MKALSTGALLAIGFALWAYGVALNASAFVHVVKLVFGR